MFGCGTSETGAGRGGIAQPANDNPDRSIQPKDETKRRKDLMVMDMPASLQNGNKTERSAPTGSGSPMERKWNPTKVGFHPKMDENDHRGLVG